MTRARAEAEAASQSVACTERVPTSESEERQYSTSTATIDAEDNNDIRPNHFIHMRPNLKKFIQPLPPTASSSFITIEFRRSSIDELIKQLTLKGQESLYFGEMSIRGRQYLEDRMRTRNAWSQNLSNIKNQIIIKQEDDSDATIADKAKIELYTPSLPKHRSTITKGATPKKGILKRKNGAKTDSPNFAFARRQGTPISPGPKKVALNIHSPTIFHYTQNGNSSHLDISQITTKQKDSPKREYTSSSDTGVASSDDMSQSGHRPSLKLKLSTTNVGGISLSELPTPIPPSAARTPSIKLSFGKKPSISVASSPAAVKDVRDKSQLPAKKRKRTQQENGSEDELAKPPPPSRRLTLKTSAAPTKTPVTPGPIFKLKTKGKIPKRPVGVGYDSELEDREIDPVLLEGVILRMPPGPDCDYIQTAIRDGTIGMHRAQGGADIRIRCLDTNGRRGVIWVNGHQYATTVVDLPCIVEGMKSWDKKGWIKSIDICQMMLVLGTCTSDEEAKNYPLPADVDPKTYAYAHGLTAPMKWVRKRRFARTRRARVDDIESIERKVNALLEADAKALSSSFQVFDRDPRIEHDQYSEVEDDYDDEDAEGEEDEDYFSRPTHTMVETPAALQADVHVDQDQIDDIEAMFDDDDDSAMTPAINGHTSLKIAGNTLRPTDLRDSSVAITSASGSPSASAAVTAAATPADDVSDEDEDDDEDASDRSDSEKDADDNLQQVKDRIADMENKIREQTDLLRRSGNAIVKKKLAKKIGELRDDVRMMKVQNGLAAEGDGDDGDE